MIRFVLPEQEMQMVQYLDVPGEFSAKLYSQYQTYGAQNKIVDFWSLLDQKETLRGVVSRMEGRLTVVLDPLCDLEELAYFLLTAGSCVYGEATQMASLNEIIHGEFFSSWIMRATGGFGSSDGRSTETGCCGQALCIRPPDRLSQVYEINCAADATFAAQMPYDGWLADVSHKVRHGLSQLYVLYRGEKAVCTMGNYFENSHTALLGGLATLKEERGSGFASMVLQYTAKAAYQRGRIPGVFAAEDRLLDFYQKNGFAPVGRWGMIHFS